MTYKAYTVDLTYINACFFAFSLNTCYNNSKLIHTISMNTSNSYNN